MAKTFLLKVGKNHTLREVAKLLTDFGYEKVLTPSQSGEYSVTGGIIKIFPIAEKLPILVDFFGDEIEKISIYDLESGKTVLPATSINIVPNKLVLEDGGVVSPNEYVVHEDQGIGMFKRSTKKEIEGEEILYFEIEYLNGDILFVPDSGIGRISKYIGIGKRRPKLSKLGSNTWKKNYAKVYEDIIKVAKELLSIYAKRELSHKVPRQINQDWNKVVTKSFGFVETDDQNKAIDAVFNDLNCTKPMDRLLCGDVGFGKTEVALRAAVQTVANGFQVVVLVPTTILSEQHYSTFKERLKELPINIARLSRFVSESAKDATIRQCKAGQIDILIGTHAILRRVIDFKALGLLVIDEEQKFGVKDKEELKQLREQIDVLSLTATPIPRTLFMSLSGLRDISLISSVPLGRKPVETEVGIYDRRKILDYIAKEIKRSGQVYYLHNEVSTIIPVKNWLQKEFPNLRVGLAHGQLAEMSLATAMKDFAEKKIDILVCSTIIENGLDLPNVNTLIVDESDKFGLSQLYQIRGRIGRSRHQAYALFTYRNKAITQNAIKRLRAIAENTELGTGYNIAIEDLEIRGGGNILGKEQHGSMETMGLILYSKLLSKAVNQLKQK